MNNRVPKGMRRRSTDTTSRVEGRPDAVTPAPVWQVTSNTPSAVPRPFADLVAGAGEVVGAAEVTAVPVPVDGGGAAGGPALWQPLSSTAPARPTAGRTRGVRPPILGPTRERLRAGMPRWSRRQKIPNLARRSPLAGDRGPSDLHSCRW